MGKMSSDTFDKTKQYVNVRLQQGVPIVDADWNEMDDVRKHEHQTFLRAFVGNGVPKDSDSFQIQAADLENDFQIVGGTSEQPGLCLVDGWEIQINETLNYTVQQLYGNGALADSWGVAHLEPLTTPSTERTDTIYLDAWERPIDSTEDPDLLNPLINIETCLRQKRDWVVRVAEDAEQPPESPPGHVYYPLARLTRINQAIISAGQIKDLRESMAIAQQSDVGQVAQDVQQIATDAFGSEYTLDKDREPNLKISLRDAINALLRGGIPSTSTTTLTIATFEPPTADYNISSLTSFTDNQQGTWVFWSINGYDSKERTNKTTIWYKHYDSITQQWEADQKLSSTTDARNYELIVLEDLKENIWLFWRSRRSNVDYIYYQRYLHSTQKWEEEQLFLRASITGLTAITDRENNIWVFWSVNSFPILGSNIYYRRYTGSWDEEKKLSEAGGFNYSPTAMVDTQGKIQVFWASAPLIFTKEGNVDICYKTYSTPEWSTESNFTIDESTDEHPLAFTNSHGENWLFWRSSRTGSKDIWYRHNWESNSDEIQLNTKTKDPKNYRVVEDNQGNILIFWQDSNNQFYYKRYNGIWEPTRQLTIDGFDHFTVTGRTNDILTLRVLEHHIQQQQLVTVI